MVAREVVLELETLDRVALQLRVVNMLESDSESLVSSITGARGNSEPSLNERSVRGLALAVSFGSM